MSDGTMRPLPAMPPPSPFPFHNLSTPKSSATSVTGSAASRKRGSDAVEVDDESLPAPKRRQRITPLFRTPTPVQLLSPPPTPQVPRSKGPLVPVNTSYHRHRHDPIASSAKNLHTPEKEQRTTAPFTPPPPGRLLPSPPISQLPKSSGILVPVGNASHSREQDTIAPSTENLHEPEKRQQSKGPSPIRSATPAYASAQEFSLSNIADVSLREKVSQIQAELPEKSVLDCCCALIATNWDVLPAAIMLARQEDPSAGE